ncbi:MAG: Glu/Leu/Phe/Val dehydrogenase [Sphingomonadales bacterium]|nr:MAG: Glu/Leu/Phe/Val dehydrogenase [Sphingomonadales bacterium]
MAFQTDHASSPASVHLLQDEATGLDGVIVLHSTTLGPAAGGCRFWAYPDREAMITDACRLAEGMSYKVALADLPLGGGKAVIRRPEGAFDRDALFRAFGRAVNALRGGYVTAEDVGTSVGDMAVVREQTRHVAGLPAGTDGLGGDPSPWTARGVFLSMQLAAERRLQRPLSECTVAVQGVGNVGAALAEMLHRAGARLIVADVDAKAAARVAIATGATVASVSSILSARADIFAPCALGGVINHATVGALKAKLVCGAANNQLAEPADGERLADRGILYAPDYVVNAGGIINVAAEYLGWSRDDATARVEGTAERLARVLDHAAKAGMAPHAAADLLARQAIAAGCAARRAA